MKIPAPIRSCTIKNKRFVEVSYHAGMGVQIYNTQGNLTYSSGNASRPDIVSGIETWARDQGFVINAIRFRRFNKALLDVEFATETDATLAHLAWSTGIDVGPDL